jgi:hypothetical protein
MAMADILAATVAERKWEGEPPHRPRVVEWIETNLRVGPLSVPTAPAPPRRARRRMPLANGKNGASESNSG